MKALSGRSDKGKLLSLNKSWYRANALLSLDLSRDGVEWSQGLRSPAGHNLSHIDTDRTGDFIPRSVLFFNWDIIALQCCVSFS